MAEDDPDVAAAIELTDDDPGGESELSDSVGAGPLERRA